MNPLPPIDALPLFPEERAALLDLLRSLSEAQWGLPTVCEGWSVKDIAAHLVSDDLGRLAALRDGYGEGRFQPTSRETAQAEFVVWVNARNESWVQAMRRLSPRMILDMLVWTGSETQAYFEALDPDKSDGFAVTWAGESESANWFDLAREYTERWHHQAQIREAAGAPLLYEPRLFAPILDTMIRAVPQALRRVQAPEGTQIQVMITGPVEREYTVLREARWSLCTGAEEEPQATLEMDGDTAWRLLTRNIARAEVVQRSNVTGDATLADAVFDSFALIA